MKYDGWLTIAIDRYSLLIIDSGVMNPPVLADLNKDGTVDIVMAMYNTTIAAFDGETHKRLWDFVFPESETYS